MLPQTNLQFYRVLANRDESESSLARVRRAYDLSRQLFAGCYRPSHKTFDAHLIGTAGALALWMQSLPVVIAGLLHSAYLYGNFGDGARGVTPARRQLVRQVVGDESESLIADYTSQRWPSSLDELQRQLAASEVSMSLVAIKLADLCDESVDGGHRHAPAKPLGLGLSDGAEALPGFLSLVEQIAGTSARDLFAEVLTDSEQVNPVAGLINADRSYHAVKPGVDGLRRSRVRQRLDLFTHRLVGKRVA